ncbi:MAG: anticodon-binding protein [Desulfurococcales archaeon ex4484_58]|nr:MAG: anticodon-binding protein [Desulfurococcales archaeon ex4484_58]
MSSEEYIGFIECLRETFTYSLHRVFNISIDQLKEYFDKGVLKITRTPNPEYGDYGIALHPLFYKHGIDKNEWRILGEKIVDLIKNSEYIGKCFINDVKYVNGYVNVYIDYSRLYKRIVYEILDYKLYDKLKRIGGGRRVIVEHTSVNPIHPLHIGNARNSVLGSTFANLLKYLGFNVSEHFYVNDMGRQVALLVYGYRKLVENNVKKPSNIKIDHWYGIIYAIVNILLEKKKLYRKAHDLEERFVEIIEKYKPILDELLSKNKEYTLLRINVVVDNIYSKLKMKHSFRELIDIITSVLRDYLERQNRENKTINSVREFLDELNGILEEYESIYEEEREYSRAYTSLCNIYPMICSVLEREISDPEHVENEVQELMYRYEAGDKEVAKFFHEVANDVLSGFKESLKKINIVFDQFDWESGEAGRKYLDEVLTKISKLPYTLFEDKALIIDLDRAAKEHDYIAKLFGKDQPGRFVLRRSDGTTLYTTRDVAYSIYKFRDLGADLVYNVIAVEQVREQRQVKSTLYLIGYRDEAEKLVHFVYEMVNLKNMKMSSRRGQYYTLDEVIEDYTRIVAEKYIENQLRLGKKKLKIEPDLLREAFRKLGIACTRALLLSTDPLKVLVFDPRRLEDYDLGSWIIYTFVRLQSILRKAYGFEPLDNIDKLRNYAVKLYEDLREKEIILNTEEKNIVETLSNYSYTLLTVYNELKPNKILEYTNTLCMTINKLYEKHPILNEKDHIKKNTRLLLVIVSLLILKDLQTIMGFPLIKKL